MSIELVGLAYDEHAVDAVWQRAPVRVAFDLILEDEFRRKVDLRSLLYHKGQLELLNELEGFLRQGGENETIVGLLAERFRAGVETFPTKTGELSFDYKLIRQFAALAMADDYLLAQRFLQELLKRIGFLPEGKPWSLIENRDYDGLLRALGEVRMSDIMSVAQMMSSEFSTVSYENLVRNYIEFLNYARNNRLTPFFYNSEADFARWGNLADRKNIRNEIIVDISMRSPRKDPRPYAVRTIPRIASGGLQEKVKRKMEVDFLIGGLKDSDPLIRLKSAESLSRLADEDCVPHLISALLVSDDEPEIRQEIVRALGATGDLRAESVLLDLIENDEVFSVQLTAAYVLRREGYRAAISALLDGVERAKPHFGTLLAHDPQLKRDKVAHARIQALVVSDNPAVRRDIAYVLGRLRTRDSVELLYRLLKDTDDQTRANALYALWDKRAKGVVEAARQLFDDPSESVARAAMIVSYWANQN